MAYTKIVFVAQTGTCREAMAAGIMADFNLRKPVEILSRGLVESFISRQLKEEDFEGALVLAMEAVQRDRILEQFENADPEHVKVLTEYVGDELEILDPYGGALPAYGLCYETLRKSIKKLVKKLNGGEE